MDKEMLSSVVKQSGGYVLGNAAGVTQAESLGPSPGQANPFNWILGHVAYWRNDVLRMLQLDPAWPAGTGAQYRGNPGTRTPLNFDAADALTIERLVADIGAMQERMEAWADRQPEPELPRHFLNMMLHEAYHAGQLGLLRRTMGKPGAI